MTISSTAWHEAGHAIAYLVLFDKAPAVQIFGEFSEGARGRTSEGEGYPWEVWGRAVSTDKRIDFFEHFAMKCMAGYLAEAKGMNWDRCDTLWNGAWSDYRDWQRNLGRVDELMGYRDRNVDEIQEELDPPSSVDRTVGTVAMPPRPSPLGQPPPAPVPVPRPLRR